MGIKYVQELLLTQFENEVKNYTPEGDSTIRNAISTLVDKKIDEGESRRTFTIDHFHIDPDEEFIIGVDEDGHPIIHPVIDYFEFISIGKDSLGRTAELKATFVVDHDLLLREFENENPSPSENDSREGAEVIVPPGITPEKSNVFDKNLKPKNNSLITVVEGTTILNDGLHFNKSGATLYTTALKAWGSFRMQQNSFLNVCQDAEFNDGVEFSGRNNSSDYEVHGNICGNATFNDDVTLNNNGIIVVGGNFRAKGSLKANPNGNRIIVFGNFTIDASKTVDSNLKICVKGNITGVSYEVKEGFTSCDQINKNGVYQLPDMIKDNSCNSFCTSPNPPSNNDEIEKPEHEANLINIYKVDY